MSKYSEWKNKLEEAGSLTVPLLKCTLRGELASASDDGVRLRAIVWNVDELLMLRDWITENFDEPKQKKL